MLSIVDFSLFSLNFLIIAPERKPQRRNTFREQVSNSPLSPVLRASLDIIFVQPAREEKLNEDAKERLAATYCEKFFCTALLVFTLN